MLFGLRGGASVFRSLRLLRQAGLVQSIHPSLRRGASPCLYYITDLGLAALALHQGVEPAHLAARYHLRGDDLSHLLPGLPQLMACYDLLAALACSRPGRPSLVTWERPWRRRFHSPARKRPSVVEIPALATLSWDGVASSFLLFPDLGAAPLPAYRPGIDSLLALRWGVGIGSPALLVATTDPWRAAAWRRMLEESGGGTYGAVTPARVVNWGDLRGGLAGFARELGSDGKRAVVVAERPPAQQSRPRRASSRLPRIVGDAMVAPLPDPPGRNWGNVALGLSPGERALLDLIGRHPFLKPGALALLSGCALKWTRERVRRLAALGLVRGFEPNETASERASLGSVELTVVGARLVAAQQGLSLARAVRYNGLAGGGPESPIGSRCQLARNLAHTQGTAGLFVALVSAAGRPASAGDDGLVEWRNAAACSRRHLRPDGYGIYRHMGHLYGFFLEYDRGTMSVRDYLRKFAAYHCYLESGAYRRDYEGFPSILMVTIDRAAEERIAQAARAAAAGRLAAIPLLLTTLWRIDRDPGNPDGLLGPIWREPGGPERGAWLQPMRRSAGHRPEGGLL
jgi:hypothetical protein